MRREKFIYNEKSLQFEKFTPNKREKAVRIIGIVASMIFTSLIILSIQQKYFPTPKEQSLQRELDQMIYTYDQLNGKLEMMSNVVDNIQERDKTVHRFMFGMDPLDDNVWMGGTGGHNPFSNITMFKKTGSLLAETQEKVNILERQLYLQSKSLDTLETLASNKEDMLASVPSIKPIREDKLKRKIRSLSGFGRRLHPVHKVLKMHTGIDFTCPTGTEIQATGNGKVVMVKKSRIGYGRHVIIDHGYGYQTVYAHMSEISVKSGQEVSKGQLIGLVGNTGTSTAPHLHYEVRYKGKPVNPIHYVMDGLNPEEYTELVNKVSIANQSFD